MPTVKFKPVKSTQIKEIGHIQDTLYVRFRNKKLFSYRPVTQEQHKEFLEAKSLGSYFHKNFKMNSKLKIQQENVLIK